MTNTQRITLASFLTYFLLSATLAPIGVISAPMAEHFDRSVTDITRQFSWLTGGILVGAVLALFVFDWFGVKKLLLSIYGLIAIGLFSLVAVDSLTWARYVLGAVGVGSGVGLAGAAITISNTYSESRRASMLVITDGFFSVAGFIVAWTAAWLIARSFGWSTTYQLLGIVAVTIVLLSFFSHFPDEQPGTGDQVRVTWPLPVWLCVGSLFLYTLGQYSMLFWLPNHISTTTDTSQAAAGSLVGQFWLGMFIAQVFVSWWVLRIGVRRLVTIASVTTLLFSIPLWIVTEFRSLFVLAFAWGFFNLAMLKAILSFATEMVATPSPRLVSLMLLGATSGTAISPLVTSQIVELTDTHVVLVFSSGCYAALFILMFAARRFDPQSTTREQVLEHTA